MRTTVEIKPEHRSALIALAAKRGHKGFSAVLEEAIDTFLEREADREKRRKAVLSLGGCLSAEEAQELRQTVGKIRENWR
jgi:predicted transcriptional regulator